MAVKGVRSESTDPVNTLTYLPKVYNSLLLSLKKLSGTPVSKVKKTDEGTTCVQSSQGRVLDQCEGYTSTSSKKDGYTSTKPNTDNSQNVLEESLSNMEYREPMLASL